MRISKFISLFLAITLIVEPIVPSYAIPFSVTNESVNPQASIPEQSPENAEPPAEQNQEQQKANSSTEFLAKEEPLELTSAPANQETELDYNYSNSPELRNFLSRPNTTLTSSALSRSASISVIQIDGECAPANRSTADVCTVSVSNILSTTERFTAINIPLFWGSTLSNPRPTSSSSNAGWFQDLGGSSGRLTIGGSDIYTIRYAFDPSEFRPKLSQISFEDQSGQTVLRLRIPSSTPVPIPSPSGSPVLSPSPTPTPTPTPTSMPSVPPVSVPGSEGPMIFFEEQTLQRVAGTRGVRGNISLPSQDSEGRSISYRLQSPLDPSQGVAVISGGYLLFSSADFWDASAPAVTGDITITLLATVETDQGPQTSAIPVPIRILPAEAAVDPTPTPSATDEPPVNPEINPTATPSPSPNASAIAVPEIILEGQNSGTNNQWVNFPAGTLRIRVGNNALVDVTRMEVDRYENNGTIERRVYLHYTLPGQPPTHVRFLLPDSMGAGSQTIDLASVNYEYAFGAAIELSAPDGAVLNNLSLTYDSNSKVSSLQLRNQENSRIGVNFPAPPPAVTGETVIRMWEPGAMSAIQSPNVLEVVNAYTSTRITNLTLMGTRGLLFDLGSSGNVTIDLEDYNNNFAPLPGPIDLTQGCCRGLWLNLSGLTYNGTELKTAEIERNGNVILSIRFRDRNNNNPVLTLQFQPELLVEPITLTGTNSPHHSGGIEQAVSLESTAFRVEVYSDETRQFGEAFNPRAAEFFHDGSGGRSLSFDAGPGRFATNRVHLSFPLPALPAGAREQVIDLQSLVIERSETGDTYSREYSLNSFSFENAGLTNLHLFYNEYGDLLSYSFEDAAGRAIVTVNFPPVEFLVTGRPATQDDAMNSQVVFEAPAGLQVENNGAAAAGVDSNIEFIQQPDGRQHFIFPIGDSVYRLELPANEDSSPTQNILLPNDSRMFFRGSRIASAEMTYDDLGTLRSISFKDEAGNSRLKLTFPPLQNTARPLEDDVLPVITYDDLLLNSQAESMPSASMDALNWLVNPQLTTQGYAATMARALMNGQLNTNSTVSQNMVRFSAARQEQRTAGTYLSNVPTEMHQNLEPLLQFMDSFDQGVLNFGNLDLSRQVDVNWYSEYANISLNSVHMNLIQQLQNARFNTQTPLPDGYQSMSNRTLANAIRDLQDFQRMDLDVLNVRWLELIQDPTNATKRAAFLAAKQRYESSVQGPLQTRAYDELGDFISNIINSFVSAPLSESNYQNTLSRQLSVEFLRAVQAAWAAERDNFSKNPSAVRARFTALRDQFSQVISRADQLGSPMNRGDYIFVRFVMDNLAAALPPSPATPSSYTFWGSDGNNRTGQLLSLSGGPANQLIPGTPAVFSIPGVYTRTWNADGYGIEIITNAGQTTATSFHPNTQWISQRGQYQMLGPDQGWSLTAETALVNFLPQEIRWRDGRVEIFSTVEINGTSISVLTERRLADGRIEKFSSDRRDAAGMPITMLTERIYPDGKRERFITVTVNGNLEPRLAAVMNPDRTFAAVLAPLATTQNASERYAMASQIAAIMDEFGRDRFITGNTDVNMAGIGHDAFNALTNEQKNALFVRPLTEWILDLADEFTNFLIQVQPRGEIVVFTSSGQTQTLYYTANFGKQSYADLLRASGWSGTDLAIADSGLLVRGTHGRIISDYSVTSPTSSFGTRRTLWTYTGLNASAAWFDPISRSGTVTRNDIMIQNRSVGGSSRWENLLTAPWTINRTYNYVDGSSLIARIMSDGLPNLGLGLGTVASWVGSGLHFLGDQGATLWNGTVAGWQMGIAEGDIWVGGGGDRNNYALYAARNYALFHMTPEERRNAPAALDRGQIPWQIDERLNWLQSNFPDSITILDGFIRRDKPSGAITRVDRARMLMRWTISGVQGMLNQMNMGLDSSAGVRGLDYATQIAADFTQMVFESLPLVLTLHGIGVAAASLRTLSTTVNAGVRATSTLEAAAGTTSRAQTAANVISGVSTTANAANTALQVYVMGTWAASIPEAIADIARSGRSSQSIARGLNDVLMLGAMAHSYVSARRGVTPRSQAAFDTTADGIGFRIVDILRGLENGTTRRLVTSQTAQTTYVGFREEVLQNAEWKPGTEAEQARIIDRMREMNQDLNELESLSRRNNLTEQERLRRTELETRARGYLEEFNTLQTEMRGLVVETEPVVPPESAPAPAETSQTNTNRAVNALSGLGRMLAEFGRGFSEVVRQDSGGGTANLFGLGTLSRALWNGARRASSSSNTTTANTSATNTAAPAQAVRSNYRVADNSTVTVKPRQNQIITFEALDGAGVRQMYQYNSRTRVLSRRNSAGNGWVEVDTLEAGRTYTFGNTNDPVGPRVRLRVLSETDPSSTSFTGRQAGDVMISNSSGRPIAVRASVEIPRGGASNGTVAPGKAVAVTLPESGNAIVKVTVEGVEYRVIMARGPEGPLAPVIRQGNRTVAANEAPFTVRRGAGANDMIIRNLEGATSSMTVESIARPGETPPALRNYSAEIAPRPQAAAGQASDVFTARFQMADGEHSVSWQKTADGNYQITFREPNASTNTSRLLTEAEFRAGLTVPAGSSGGTLATLRLTDTGVIIENRTASSARLSVSDRADGRGQQIADRPSTPAAPTAPAPTTPTVTSRPVVESRNSLGALLLELNRSNPSDAGLQLLDFLRDPANRNYLERMAGRSLTEAEVNQAAVEAATRIQDAARTFFRNQLGDPSATALDRLLQNVEERSTTTPVVGSVPSVPTTSPSLEAAPPAPEGAPGSSVPVLTGDGGTLPSGAITGGGRRVAFTVEGTDLFIVADVPPQTEGNLMPIWRVRVGTMQGGLPSGTPVVEVSNGTIWRHPLPDGRVIEVTINPGGGSANARLRPSATRPPVAPPEDPTTPTVPEMPSTPTVPEMPATPAGPRILNDFSRAVSVAVGEGIDIRALDPNTQGYLLQPNEQGGLTLTRPNGSTTSTGSSRNGRMTIPISGTEELLIEVSDGTATITRQSRSNAPTPPAVPPVLEAPANPPPVEAPARFGQPEALGNGPLQVRAGAESASLFILDLPNLDVEVRRTNSGEAGIPGNVEIYTSTNGSEGRLRQLVPAGQGENRTTVFNVFGDGRVQPSSDASAPPPPGVVMQLTVENNAGTVNVTRRLVLPAEAPAPAPVAPAPVEPPPVAPAAPAAPPAPAPMTRQQRARQTIESITVSEGGETYRPPVVENLLSAPDINAILNQIPEGSTVLGHGNQAVVLSTPDGNVMRIGYLESTPRSSLPNDLVLQAESRTVVGTGDNAWQVEVLPRVETGGFTEADVTAMTARLRERGYTMRDPGPDNLGRLPNGDVVVIDPGAVRALRPNEIQPVVPVAPAAPAAPLADPMPTQTSSTAGSAAEDLASEGGDQGSFTIAPNPEAESVTPEVSASQSPTPTPTPSPSTFTIAELIDSAKESAQNLLNNIASVAANSQSPAPETVENIQRMALYDSNTGYTAYVNGRINSDGSLTILDASGADVTAFFNAEYADKLSEGSIPGVRSTSLYPSTEDYVAFLQADGFHHWQYSFVEDPGVNPSPVLASSLAPAPQPQQASLPVPLPELSPMVNLSPVPAPEAPRFLGSIPSLISSVQARISEIPEMIRPAPLVSNEVPSISNLSNNSEEFFTRVEENPSPSSSALPYLTSLRAESSRLPDSWALLSQSLLDPAQPMDPLELQNLLDASYADLLANWDPSNPDFMQQAAYDENGNPIDMAAESGSEESLEEPLTLNADNLPVWARRFLQGMAALSSTSSSSTAPNSQSS